MNEMSEFYDESEETSDLIEERLAKTINTSLRTNISPFSVLDRFPVRETGQ
jgi:hypothetical protein